MHHQNSGDTNVIAEFRWHDYYDFIYGIIICCEKCQLSDLIDGRTDTEKTEL